MRGVFKWKQFFLILSAFHRVWQSFLVLHAWCFYYTKHGSCPHTQERFSDVNIFSRKNWKQFFWGWYVAFICFQALVKGGASSQSMAADEFIVGAAEVLLEQVWPVFVLCHVTSNSSLLSMQSASLVIGSELSSFCVKPCFLSAEKNSLRKYFKDNPGTEGQTHVHNNTVYIRRYSI